MHSRHAECIVENYYFFAWCFWISRNIYVSTKLTLGVIGMKITTLSQEPVNHKLIVKYKSFLKLLKIVVPYYRTFS